MLLNNFYKPFTFIALYFLGVTASAQCFPNMGFTDGNLDGWKCFWGTVSPGSPGNKSVPVWLSYTANPNNHMLMNGGTDPVGGFPRQAPLGGTYSLRLGKDECGGQAEGVSYTFTVPNSTTFSMIFKYAVVLHDIHFTEDRPRFRAFVYNETDNVPIPCLEFDFTENTESFSTVPGSILKYKPWTQVTLRLGKYAGKKLRIEFFTTDCADQTDCEIGPPPGHFCYAYIDFNGSCELNDPVGVCQETDRITLTAPEGFTSYRWYSDVSYATILNLGRTYSISPRPPAGTVYKVVVTPPAGQGCNDTLNIIVPPYVLSDIPRITAGPDVLKCIYDVVTLGAPVDFPGYIYNWTSSHLLNNPTTAQPSTIPGVKEPVTFIVTKTNAFTGCFAKDTVVVTPIIVDTTMTVTGESSFCEGGGGDTKFTATGDVDSVHWMRNKVKFPGENGLTFIPSGLATAGTYQGLVWKDGCHDSTRKVQLKILKKPTAKFSVGGDQACLYMPTYFKNESTAPPDQTLKYQWIFSDGTQSIMTHPRKEFNSLDPLNATLIVTSSVGCRDTARGTISVISNCGVYVPTGFSPNNDGLNDKLIPVLSSDQVMKKFRIYDRAGSLIYSTSTRNQGWDGRYKGLPLNGGVYVWTLEYDTNEQKGILIKGTVILIR